MPRFPHKQRVFSPSPVLSRFIPCFSITLSPYTQRLCQANPAELECDVEVDDKEQKRQFRQWAERVSGNAILHPKSCVSYEESLEALDMMSIKHGFGDFLS